MYDSSMETADSVIDESVLNGAEFVEAWAAHERDAAHLALAARRLEVSGEWAYDGSVSMHRGSVTIAG